MTDPTPIPTPGSDAAIAAGCLCPVTDNHSGAGYVVREGVVTYWQNPACPLHGTSSGYTVLRDYSPAAEWDSFSEQDSRERQDGVIASWRPAQELHP